MAGVFLDVQQVHLTGLPDILLRRPLLVRLFRECRVCVRVRDSYIGWLHVTAADHDLLRQLLWNAVHQKRDHLGGRCLG